MTKMTQREIMQRMLEKRSVTSVTIQTGITASSIYNWKNEKSRCYPQSATKLYGARLITKEDYEYLINGWLNPNKN